MNDTTPDDGFDEEERTSPDGSATTTREARMTNKETTNDDRLGLIDNEIPPPSSNMTFTSATSGGLVHCNDDRGAFLSYDTPSSSLIDAETPPNPRLDDRGPRLEDRVLRESDCSTPSKNRLPSSPSRGIAGDRRTPSAIHDAASRPNQYSPSSKRQHRQSLSNATTHRVRVTPSPHPPPLPSSPSGSSVSFVPSIVSESRPVSRASSRASLVVPRQPAFRLYKRRWLILVAASMLNMTNAFNWLTLAPIATTAATYFQVDDQEIDWFSQVFFISAIPFSASFWAIDVVGLRPCLIAACWLNCLGVAIRALAYLDFAQLPHMNFYMGVIGQTIASMAQPTAMASGTKIAATWFPDNQRVLANAVISLSNCAGMMIANALVPKIVTSASQVGNLLLYSSIPSGFLAIFASLVVCSSLPPSPPCASASSHSPPFFPSLKRLLKSKNFWMLLQLGGCGIGIFSALLTMLQQSLCVKGYTASFAGACGAGAIGAGLIISLIVGTIVDKSKYKGKLEEILKVLFTFAVLGLSGYGVAATFSHSSDSTACVLISLLIFGGFGLATTPLILELVVETHYPAPEATAAGAIFLFGQIVGAVIITLSPILAVPASAADVTNNRCKGVSAGNIGGLFGAIASGIKVNDGDLSKELELAPAPAQDLMDMKWWNAALSGLAALSCCIFVVFFRADYVRTKIEQKEAAKKILNFCRRGSAGGDIGNDANGRRARSTASAEGLRGSASASAERGSASASAERGSATSAERKRRNGGNQRESDGPRQGTRRDLSNDAASSSIDSVIAENELDDDAFSPVNSSLETRLRRPRDATGDGIAGNVNF